MAGFGAAPVLAAEFGYGAAYSLVHDSNITRVSNDTIAEWVQSLIGGFAYQERTTDLSARLFAQVERREYVRNTFGNENVYTANGAALWAISPQQVTWTVEDFANQVRVNITTPDTPSNRVNANTLSTGPNFTVRLDPTNTAAFGGRYGRLDIEGPGDNTRRSAYLRLLHQVSVLTKLSLNYEATRVYFDDPALSSNFLREERYLRYETRMLVGSLAIDGGTTRVSREGVDNLNGKVARLTLFRPLTSESSIQASYASQVSDTGIDLLSGVTTTTQTAGAVSSTPSTIVAANDVYRSRRSDIAYENRSSRFGFSLRGYKRSVDFQQLPQDLVENYARIECNWPYSGDVRVRAYTDYLKRTFQDFFQRDTVRNSALAVTYALTRNVNIAVEGARFEQSSTSQFSFVDRRVMLLLSYTSGPPYQVQSAQFTR